MALRDILVTLQKVRMDGFTLIRIVGPGDPPSEGHLNSVTAGKLVNLFRLLRIELQCVAATIREKGHRAHHRASDQLSMHCLDTASVADLIRSVITGFQVVWHRIIPCLETTPLAIPTC